MKKLVVMLVLACFAGTMIAQNTAQQAPANVYQDKDHKDKDRDHDKDHDKDHHRHHHHHDHDHDHKGGDKK